MNITLLEMARCMLHFKSLHNTFWGLFVSCVAHIINRIPTKALTNITPEEAWSGKKPHIGYFKVFGSIAWAHILDAQREKLEPKSHKCLFVGYSEESKAYRLYDLTTKKVYVSRDVKFDEHSQLTATPSHSTTTNASHFKDILGRNGDYIDENELCTFKNDENTSENKTK